VDRALGTLTVAEALRASGCKVEIHDRHFAQDAKDAEWLPEVGSRGWVVLTKDRHIRTRQSELIALLGAGVAAFVLMAPQRKAARGPIAESMTGPGHNCRTVR
jgi:hypothetical protein